MPEPSLALTYDDLRAEVGTYLGYGGDSAEWDDQQESDIESAVRSGLRQFYWPPPLEGQPGGYDWSFLKPTASLALEDGDQTVALPDDFGGVEGRITVSPEDSQVFSPISLHNEGYVREQYSAFPSMTGRPSVAAVRPLKGTTKTQGQRHELYVFPEADDDYTLNVSYYVNPGYLDAAFPYHMGGAQHAETVLESCLAIAEQRKDDQMAVHTMKFQERLRASIAADRKLKSQLLGYNRDRSDERHRLLPGRWPYVGNRVTFNGVTP